MIKLIGNVEFDKREKAMKVMFEDRRNTAT